jgi:hypothetical protein
MSRNKRRGSILSKLIWGVALFIAVPIAIAVIIASREPGRQSASPPSPPSWHAQADDIARLGYPGGGGSTVWLCADESAWDVMIKAERESTGAALHRLIQAGKVKALPVERRVRITKVGAASCRVSILDGEDRGTEG